MDSIRFILNGEELETTADATILEAAREAGVDIPTLCYLKGINRIASCRMCVVEVKGAKGPLPACVTAVTEGMEICTESDALFETRHRTLELICSEHRFDCEYCERYSECELHALMRIYSVDEHRLEYGENLREADRDISAVHLVRDRSKCVQCRRCVNTCEKAQGIEAIAVLGRGPLTRIGPAMTLDADGCVHCGQCVANCPTGALVERDETRVVWRAIMGKDTYVAAVVSPFAASAFSRSLLYPDGDPRPGKFTAALRRMGFDAVYDGRAGLLLSAGELAQRLRRAADTVYSWACPSYELLCETKYPALMPEDGSPTENFARKCRDAAMANGKTVYMVSIVPCTAEKRAVYTGGADAALTVNEVADMFRRACVSRFTARGVWQWLPEERFDTLPGWGNEMPDAPAGGGILEAAIRILTDGHFRFGPADTYGVSEAGYIQDGQVRKAALVTGLGNAGRLLDKLNADEVRYDAVEVMACPGGCSAGGGLPRRHAKELNFG